MDPTTFQETPQLVIDEPVIPKVGYIISRYTSESTAPGLSLICSKNREYTYFGPFQSLSPIPESLQIWSKKNIKGDFLPHIKQYLEYVHSFLSQKFPEYNCYWFEIRLSKGSEEYILPRWHCDGVYFDTQKDQHFKLVTTLLGPGTLFLKNGVEARSIEREEETRVDETLDSMDFENYEARMKERRRLEDKQRMNLAERLDEWERVQLKFGECARFRVGNGEAAVHSEPDSRGDRVFVSVLPGRESELREMAERWGCPWGEALE